MNHPVQVLEIERDAKPTDRPRAAATFEVAAYTHEAARRAALERLTREGRTVRSISHLAAGGLVAVVTEPPSAPSAKQLLRAQRGG